MKNFYISLVKFHWCSLGLDFLLIIKILTSLHNRTEKASMKIHCNCSSWQATGLDLRTIILRNATWANDATYWEGNNINLKGAEYFFLKYQDETLYQSFALKFQLKPFLIDDTDHL